MVIKNNMALNNNLPLFSNRNLINKPTSGSINRAQNFSVSRLNIRKDIDEAKVSISQVGKTQRPTTSINRATNPNNNNNNSTSASHTKIGNNSDEYNQEEADNKRYEHIRRLAMARKKERDLAEKKDGKK
jgi:hypothetical protein